jgi:outer membrane receptor for Fe3+-dicitrate
MTLISLSKKVYIMNAFQSAFSLIQNTIEFKPEFNNGTGYLDGLATLDGLFTPYENLMADTNSQKTFIRPLPLMAVKLLW